MLTTRVIHDPAEWHGLAGEWNELLAGGVTDSVFLTYEWLNAWWRAFASPGDRLHIVAAFRDGRLCAAAPLLSRRAKSMGLPVRSLRAMINPHTPKYDWLWRGGDSEAFTALVETIRRSGGWDMLRLDYVPGESPTLAMFAEGGAAVSLRTFSEPCIRSPYLPIRGTWDEYFASMSHKFRKEVRYGERKLKAMGELTITEICGGPDLTAALRSAYAVEQSSWKGDKGTAIANRANEMRFYDEVAAAASRRGWLRLYFLELNGRPLAFDYCLDYRRTMNAVKTGYDPAFAKHSPGIVMRMQLIKKLFDEGRHDKYDLLGAALDWKVRICGHVQELRSLFAFPRRPFGAALYQLQFGIKLRLERYPRVREALRRVKARIAGAREVSAQE